MKTWVFVIVPGLLTMLFALIFRRPPPRWLASTSRVARLTVAIATWLAVSVLISTLWCSGISRVACSMNVALVTGIIGGGRRCRPDRRRHRRPGPPARVNWLTYPGAAPKPVAPTAGPKTPADRVATAGIDRAATQK
jgi:hypothetical protein